MCFGVVGEFPSGGGENELVLGAENPVWFSAPKMRETRQNAVHYASLVRDIKVLHRAVSIQARAALTGHYVHAESNDYERHKKKSDTK